MSIENHLAAISKVRQSIAENTEKFAALQETRAPIALPDAANSDTRGLIATASTLVLAQAASDFFAMNHATKSVDQPPMRLIEATPPGDPDHA